MKKVNLIIIGAGRSGTTSLYHYMKDHPDVCFSDIKEVHFFSLKNLYKRGEGYFHSYFTKFNNQKILATADTYLLIDKKAPERIFSYNPEMKIIALLRDPVDRAYSSFNYALNNGYEKQSVNFLQSLNMEKDRLNEKDIIQLNNLCHFYGGLYYTHLNFWRRYFPKENFLILSTHELKNSPQGTLNKISGFLKISSFNTRTFQVTNKAATVKSKGLQQFLLNRNHPLRNLLRPMVKPLKFIIIHSGIIDLLYKINKKESRYRELSQEERKAVTPYFEEDLKNLKEEYTISFPE